MAILKGCIFDIDGTLADSMGIWGDIDRAFLEKRSIAMPDDYIDALNSMSFSQAAEYTIKRFSLDESPEAIMNEWKAMSEYAYAHTIKLKEGVPEFLENLRESLLNRCSHQMVFSDISPQFSRQRRREGIKAIPIYSLKLPRDLEMHLKELPFSRICSRLWSQHVR